MYLMCPSNTFLPVTVPDSQLFLDAAVLSWRLSACSSTTEDKRPLQHLKSQRNLGGYVTRGISVLFF